MEPTDENLRAWEKAHTPTPTPEERLPGQVRGSLADLAAKRVLHLNCGSGGVSAEFAALGASVTAVDASSRAIHLGRQRASSVLFIAAEPHALPAELRRARFDLVYGGPGTVQGTPDLDLFATNVAGALRPGADLLLFDDHPAALCVDGLLHWRDDYFDAGFHRLGQVVGALARQHLSVRALEEYPAAAGTHRDARIPGTFLLHARKNR